LIHKSFEESLFVKKANGGGKFREEV